MIKKAMADGGPYALAFVDMRMPPGWDGLETIEHAWKECADLQVVICTAYSDYPWNEISKRLGASENVLVLKKPFDNVEVSQMAIALTEKSRLTQESRLKLDELEQRVRERTAALAAEFAERMRSEEAQRALKDAVAAMSQVIGVVGHELRTPLAGLRVISELLLDQKVKEAGSVDSFLKSINSEVIRMSNMVNNMLEAARISSGGAVWNWTTVDLAAACNQAIDAVRPLVDAKRVQLLCRIDPPDLSMNGDTDAIRRLILNLLGNAQKYTTDGSISIRAAAVREGPTRWVQIEIQDTGEGIPPHIAAKLGQAFALNSGIVGGDHVKGSGLGLAICKGIVAAHGGTLAVKSAPGAGTVVTVRLRPDLSNAVCLREAVSHQEVAS
jgi:signal transduction histidine kinase